MGINRRLAEAEEKLSKDYALPKKGPWDDIINYISKGRVMPVISSSFRIEEIFNDGSDASSVENGALSINEQLISIWANLINYPMQDKHNLARVAQYHLVEQKDPQLARTEYLDFLKRCLLTSASEDTDYADLALRLKPRIQELSFSEIVHQLDYPRFPDSTEDPLRLLSRLHLPIYLTTSQSDFVERALEAEGKKPRTQICFWSGEISTLPEHQTDPEFVPTPTNPMVYHLYGLERYPQTLVLSEDDYLNFLIKTAEDTNMLNPIVPLSLRRALGESQLILLGYRLADWDFRVLFPFIFKFRKGDFSPNGIIIQLQRDQGNRDDDENAEEAYLKRYFDNRKFEIKRSDPEGFIRKLWEEWNKDRR